MLRFLLAPLRLLGILLLLGAGLVLGTLVLPWLAQRGRNCIQRAWSRALLAVCGLRLTLAGGPRTAGPAPGTGPAGAPGRLLLANHVSWIDPFALAAVLPAHFVAKAEIGRWPLLGLLASMAGTLYIERGRRRAVQITNGRVRDCLRAGRNVAIFPEGTTTDGSRLLPLHSNLIAPALEIGAPVWPVALRYTEAGRPSAAAAFVDQMSLARSLWRVLTARRLGVEVALLPPLADEARATRQQAAQAAGAAIAGHLGIDAAD